MLYSKSLLTDSKAKCVTMMCNLLKWCNVKCHLCIEEGYKCGLPESVRASTTSEDKLVPSSLTDLTRK